MSIFFLTNCTTANNGNFNLEGVNFNVDNNINVIGGNGSSGNGSSGNGDGGREEGGSVSVRPGKKVLEGDGYGFDIEDNIPKSYKGIRNKSIEKLLESEIYNCGKSSCTKRKTNIFKGYINHDQFADFCYQYSDQTNNGFYCSLSNGLGGLGKEISNISQFLIRGNYIFPTTGVTGIKYSFDFGRIVDQTDKNGDGNNDITTQNSANFKQVYLNDGSGIFFKFSKQYSEEETVDGIVGDGSYGNHISDVIKTINKDGTTNYSIRGTNGSIIFSAKKQHGLLLNDLNKDGYKDILTFENYITDDGLKYKIFNIYQYDQQEGIYKLNLSNIDAVGIFNSDINGDGKDDLIIERLDGKSYIYENKGEDHNFEKNNIIQGDKFELLDFNGDGNKDLISFSFYGGSRDYGTYNLYIRNGNEFSKINDESGFIGNNLKQYKSKCGANDYLSFIVEKQGKRKYIYFNNSDGKYKGIEGLPLLNNDDTFFGCYGGYVEYKETVDGVRGYLIMKNDHFSNMLDNYLGWIYFGKRDNNDRNHRMGHFIRYTGTTPTYLDSRSYHDQRSSDYTRFTYLGNVINFKNKREIEVTKSENGFPLSNSIGLVTGLRNGKYISTLEVVGYSYGEQHHRSDLLNKYMIEGNKFGYLLGDTLTFYRLHRGSYEYVIHVGKLDLIGDVNSYTLISDSNFKNKTNFQQGSWGEKEKFYVLGNQRYISLLDGGRKYCSTTDEIYEKYKKYSDILRQRLAQSTTSNDDNLFEYRKCFSGALKEELEK